MSNFFSELFEFFSKIFSSQSAQSHNVLTDDEKVYIEKHFKPADQAIVIKTLENAVQPADIDAGCSPEKRANGINRQIRSALVGSHGSVEELKRLAAVIKAGDGQDAILTGEVCGGDLEKVVKYTHGEHISPLYDLKKPFDKDGKPASAR